MIGVMRLLTNCLLAAILVVLSIFCGRYYWATAKQDAIIRIAKIETELAKWMDPDERESLKREKLAIQNSWDL